MTFFTKLRRAVRYKRLKAIRRRHLSKIIPAYSNCKNCDTKLNGVFCHKCGQSSRDTTLSFLKFVNSYFENTFQTDGRIFSTLRLLFFKPGKLSLEFINGHIIKYVHPMKLFLFCSIFLFTVMWFVYESGIEKEKPLFGKNDKVSIELRADSSSNTVKKIDSSEIIKNIADSLKTSGSYVIMDTNDIYFTQLRTLSQELNDNNKRDKTSTVKDVLKRDVPFIFMMLMPFYALILKRFFRRSYKNYLPHFVFAIHINTLLLILLTLIVCSAVFKDFIASFSFFALVTFVGYIIVATRVFYGQNWLRTVFKSLFVLFLVAILGSVISLLGIAVSLVYNLQN